MYNTQSLKIQKTKSLWFSKRILNVEIQFVKDVPSWAGSHLPGLMLQEANS